MFGGIGLQKLKQVVSLASLGAEVDVGQKYRADLLCGHAGLTVEASLPANITGSLSGKLAPAVIDKYSMRTEWHGNISSLLRICFANVNLLVPRTQ